MSTFRTRAFLGVAASLFSLGVMAEEGTFDRTLAVDGRVELRVDTGSGSITVRPGASARVTIHGTVRTGSGLFGGGSADKVRRIAENPPIEQQGNVVRIGNDRGDDDLYRNVSISYEIEAPEETSLVTHTGSGRVTIGSIQGPVDASSGSGSLRIGSIGGAVKAKTGSGSVEIEGVNGSLEVSAGSGSIEARHASGPISVRTGSGSIELEQQGPGDVVVDSGSGEVRLRGVSGGLDVDARSGSIFVEGVVAKDWRISSSSGSVTLELPENAGFELDARTSSGHIELERPVTVQGRLSRKVLRGTVGGGGPKLQIDTSSGSIEIR